MKKQLGPEICNNILFIHAILGCDTTSHLYGIGKSTSLKKFKPSKHFQQQAKVFCSGPSIPMLPEIKHLCVCIMGHLVIH